MDPQTLLHPSLVDAAARAAARRQHLPPRELDDLRSALWVKLLDRDGHVVRRFSGRGSFFGYLVRVARRMVLDERAARLGKWRPGLRTSNLGADAVTWTKLVERDGLSPAEASSRLHLDRNVAQSALAVSLATRRPPRRFVPIEECPATRLATHRGPADEMQRRDACRKVRRALMRAMRQLTRDERRWLRWRFYDGLRIAEIAQRDRRRPMECYREYARLLARLQKHLAAAGVDGGLVAAALDR